MLLFSKKGTVVLPADYGTRGTLDGRLLTFNNGWRRRYYMEGKILLDLTFVGSWIFWRVMPILA